MYACEHVLYALLYERRCCMCIYACRLYVYVHVCKYICIILSFHFTSFSTYRSCSLTSIIYTDIVWKIRGQETTGIQQILTNWTLIANAMEILQSCTKTSIYDWESSLPGAQSSPLPVTRMASISHQLSPLLVTSNTKRTALLLKDMGYNMNVSVVMKLDHPDSKVHGAIMGPVWGRQDPCRPHGGPMNFATWASMNTAIWWMLPIFHILFLEITMTRSIISPTEWKK